MKKHTTHIVKGFVGGIFVYLHFVSGIIFAIFAISNFLLFDEYHPLLPLQLLACLVVKCIIDYSISPLAYKRFRVDSDGIKCGKAFIKYDKIESISLHRGVIYSWYGLRWLEEYTGFKQHFNIHVGVIISIDESFSSFESRDAKQSLCIPLTKNVHDLLNTHCAQYSKNFNLATILDYKHDKSDRMNIMKIAFSVFTLLLYCLGLVAAVANMNVSTIGSVMCWIEALLLLLFTLFKEEISFRLQRRKIWELQSESI